eukprot:TRINITY_DN11350_c0_g1_i2.p1 TRINITY_DN11350_c0_g1~~TRINITY_DN11350_c0_g1_i2.p1  ORF type:complete len:1066 (+),score=422.63 TRINITY_DN11350_c0_g1_i2:118-3315(+)
MAAVRGLGRGSEGGRLMDAHACLHPGQLSPGQLTPPLGNCSQSSVPSSVPPSPSGTHNSHSQHSHSPHGGGGADGFNDFSRAVRMVLVEPACFVPTGQSPAAQGAWALRQQAEHYLLRLKHHPQVWSFACSVLSRPPQLFVASEVFWCCGTLVEHVAQGRYAALPEAGKGAFEAVLMGWVRNVCPHIKLSQHPHVRNKFAQLMVTTMQQAYPVRWGSFFDELFGTLDLGDDVIELWLRILETIDEIIVDRETQASRPAAQRDRDTAIKDAMRTQCVPRIVQTWYHILARFHERRPDICRQCMTTLCPYIEWIDINLVSSEAWVNMLYHFLGLPQLREEAVECLLTLSEKKISDPSVKLELLGRLRVTDAMPKVVARLLESGREPLRAGMEEFDGSDFLQRTGELVQGVAIELADVVGSFLNAGADQPAQLALSMLNACLPMLWQLLAEAQGSLSLQICEHFTRKYVDLLKRQEKLPRAEVPRILGLLRLRLQYHPRYNFDQAGDYETVVDSLRKQLLIVFRNLCALERDVSCGFVSEIVTAMLAAGERAHWFEVEAVLRLLYTLGEELAPGLVGVFKNPDAELTQLFDALVRSPTASGTPHPCVALAYMECMQRYNAYFQHQARERVPLLMMQLLGSCGVQHPAPRVRSRCCGIFAFLAKSLKQQLLWCLGAITQAVHGLLCGPDILGERDRCALYETVGVLVQSVAAEELDRALQCLAALSKPLVGTLRALLAQPPSDQLGHSIAQTIASLCALSKGFSGIAAPAVGRAPERVLAVWAEITETVIQSVQTYRQHGAAREKALLFTHRMIDLQGPRAVPLVDALLRHLLPVCDLSDLPKVVRLPTQLLQRIRADAVPTVDAVFGELLTRVFGATSLDWLGKPELMHTEQAREHLELLRAVYLFFLQGAQPECIGLFLSERSRPQLGAVLDALGRGCTSHPEMEMAKTCYQVLTRMVASWVGAVEGFGDFVAQKVLPTTLLTVQQTWFHPSDAKSVAVLGEIAALLHAVLTKVGPDALAAAFAQQWQLPPQDVAKVVQALQAGDLNHKQARNELRAIVARAKPALH